MVAPELDEEEDEDACDCANGGYVEEVLDVAVPCRFEIVVSGGRRWEGEGVIGGDGGGEW